jgi:hypothetical protein
MAGSGAAFPRANSALAKSQALSNNLASGTPGADGASHVASNDTVGGALWSTVGGFMAALLAGQVANSQPTRAQMVANKVPAAVTTICTSGYSTAGDGGGAAYVRATGPFTDGSSFQSTDGQWWKLSMPAVTLAMFGAIGGTPVAIGSYSTLPDDTTAIQNAITYALANCGGLVGVGPRYYRFTKSLNCGKAYPFSGAAIRIVGQSYNQSRLIADLTENYPAFDFTNQNRGQACNLWVETSTTSQHSCVMVFAETQGSGMNSFTARDLTVNDYGAVSKMAAFGWSADQFNADNSSFGSSGPNALCGAYFGLLNPGGIASKFYTVAENDADGTLFLGNNSAFTSGTGPGLWVQGFNQLTLTGCYFNVQGIYGHATTGHSKGMLRLCSTPASGQRFLTAALTGCRFEDQAANNLPSSPTVVVTGTIAPNADGQTSTLTVTGTATGALVVGNILTSAGSGFANDTTVLANVSANVWTVSNSQTVASTTFNSYLISSPCVYVEDYVYESKFEGWFNSSGAGVFGGPGQHIASRVSVGGTSLAPWFNASGALVGGAFHFTGGSNNIGLFDQANSRQYKMGGRIGTTWANVLSAIGSTVDELADNFSIEAGDQVTSWMRSERRILMPYANAPTNYRMATKGECGVPGYYASYVAGSGLQTIGNFLTALPGALRNSNSQNFLVFPNWELEILGQFASGMVAGTSLTIAIQQILPGGAKYATLVNLGSIPAYGPAVGWKACVRLMPGYSNSLTAWTTLETIGSAPISTLSSGVSLSSGGFDMTQNVPFSVNILVNSPSAAPLGTGFLYRVI